MKVKFTGDAPFRFWDTPVQPGDILDLDDKTAKEALSSARFVPVEANKPKPKSKKKSQTTEGDK